MPRDGLEMASIFLANLFAGLLAPGFYKVDLTLKVSSILYGSKLPTAPDLFSLI